MHKLEQRGETPNKADICASFQKTAVDMLVDTATAAVEQTGIRTLCLAGGVAANSYLRDKLKTEGGRRGAAVYYPPMSLCTDNAAMICARARGMIAEGAAAAKLDLNAVSYLKL